MALPPLEVLIDWSDDGFTGDVTFTNKQAAVAGQFANFSSRPVRVADSARVQIARPPSLSSVAGGALIWFDPDYDHNDASQPALAAVFCYGTYASGRLIRVMYDKANAQWFVQILDPSSGGAYTVLADTFSAGDGKMFYIGWDTSSVEIAVGSGSVASTSRTYNAWSAGEFANVDVANQEGGYEVEGCVAAAALLEGKLSTSDREYFASLTRPPLFGERIGRSMLALWYGESDVYYDDADDIVTEAFAFSTSYGRNAASQVTARAVAGVLNLEVRNNTGRFSPDNSASPLAGLMKSGRAVQLRMASSANHHNVWGGFLDGPPGARFDAGHLPVATLRAQGPIAQLTDAPGEIDAQANKRTDELVGLVLDAAGWPSADRSLQTGQSTPVIFYTKSEALALPVLREIEDTEIGFLRETKDRKIAFEDRHYRLVGDRLTSQATFSDAAAAALSYKSVDREPPLANLFNVAKVSVLAFGAPAAVTTLWTFAGGSFDLAPGQSRTLIAQWPTSQAAHADGAYVDAWTTPDATDITVAGVAFADLGIATVKNARSMPITITNNHASDTATISAVRARGSGVDFLDPTVIEVDESTDRRYVYPVPARWLSDADEGQDFAEAIVARNNPPAPYLTVVVSPLRNASSNLATLLALDLSDRVTVVADNVSQMGIDGPFYIEAIKHRYTLRGWELTLLLSGADQQTYWVLGDAVLGQLGITTRLGY